MMRRSADGCYVDVKTDGFLVTSSVESLFIPARDIRKIRYSLLKSRLIIWADRRRIKIKRVIEKDGTPAKIPLWKWLSSPSPSRKEMRKGLRNLKQALDGIIPSPDLRSPNS